MINVMPGKGKQQLKRSGLIFGYLFILLFPLILTAKDQTGKTRSYKIREKQVNAVKPDADKLIYGKYGCTASKYRNGSYEYIPRGSFTLNKNGKYTYYGFKKPSSGTFLVDKKGNLLFKGGYFEGGKAEKIDRPNKFFLVFPGNPDNRWTCSLVN